MNTVTDEATSGNGQHELKLNYNEIMALYDLTDELAATVESQFVTGPEAQLAIVEPLIAGVGEAVDVLTEEYINVLEKPSNKKTSRLRIEAAMRRIFTSIDEYRQRVQNKGKRLANGFWNVADPIVEKLQKQMERVVVIFLNLLEISLDRIMHSAQIEEMKREQHYAARLTQLGY
jgi:hypothetical protein